MSSFIDKLQLPILVVWQKILLVVENVVHILINIVILLILDGFVHYVVVGMSIPNHK
jgi:hypothetical protein